MSGSDCATVWHRKATNVYSGVDLAVCIPCRWLDVGASRADAATKCAAHNAAEHAPSRVNSETEEPQ